MLGVNGSSVTAWLRGAFSKRLQDFLFPPRPPCHGLQTAFATLPEKARPESCRRRRRTTESAARTDCTVDGRLRGRAGFEILKKLEMLVRREFLTAVLAGLHSARSTRQTGVSPAPSSLASDVIAAPDDPAEWPAFRERLAQWRAGKRRELNYDDRLDRREDLKWAATSFACSFVMLYDEQFYSPREARYRVSSWLEEGVREFGGYDSVVLWHAYPRIGVDQRNQFDMYRDMPGGLDGLRTLTAEFHKRKVKVYIDYNPWDTGTRREGKEDTDALADMVGAIHADGIFLDTLKRSAAQLRPRLDAVRPGVVLEGEIALPLENVHDHHLSWAQWFRDSKVPGILRNKWFERRHMQHQIRRWNHDHSEELQMAWMNGSGILVWENVFGSWVGWTERDKSILRQMLPVQRRFAHLFTGEGWTPLVPVLAGGVYASLWESDGVRLWTLVNRTDQRVHGKLLRVPAAAGERFSDLIAGRRLKPGIQGGMAMLEGEIGPRGIGCFLAQRPGRGREQDGAFLNSQAALQRRANCSTHFPARRTQLREAPAAPLRTAAPEGMVAIGPVDFDRPSEYRVRECGQLTSQDYQPGRGHHPIHKSVLVRRTARLARYAIDVTPVTNAEFARFLAASGHEPRHKENFLKHWHSGRPPAGQEDHPVVYVGLEDARAYARWASKRLPTELEWQYAAEGPAGLLYPWGNEWKPGLCNTGETGGTTPVRAYPGGRSPFGCYDMCGNTWEWTESEYSDGRTRFAILRGGSYYRASGSDWYTDGGPQSGRFGLKFLLLWPGLDRCATVGFRCAVPLEHGAA